HRRHLLLRVRIPATPGRPDVLRRNRRASHGTRASPGLRSAVWRLLAPGGAARAIGSRRRKLLRRRRAAGHGAVIEIADVAALGELIDRELALSDWLEVTQARIDRFAEATDDRQWIH